MLNKSGIYFKKSIIHNLMTYSPSNLVCFINDMQFYSHLFPEKLWELCV